VCEREREREREQLRRRFPWRQLNSLSERERERGGRACGIGKELIERKK